jgi:Uma2 family endonuclease
MAAMVARSTSTPVPLGEYVPTADSVIVMNGISWEGYESLLALRGERSRPKLAYLDGAVELMTTSRGHEGIKGNVACLVEQYCLHVGIDFTTYGNWTLKKKIKRAGVEADECYIFGPTPKLKARPDLAIEIVWTSGGIDKLEVYRRLGVGEVWFWSDDAISVHVLEGTGYKARDRSV